MRLINLKKLSILFLLLFSIPTIFTGQERSRKFKPELSFRDISAGAGLYVNTRTNRSGTNAYLYVNYGNFFYNGFGVRGGFQYVPDLCSVSNAFGFPLYGVYRIRTKTNTDFVDAAVTSAVSYKQSYDSPASFILSFLLCMLPPNVEFSAGLTPGWIAGKSIEKKSSFTLSADLGLKLSYRIWRFNLNVAPGVHYYITDNFRELNINSTSNVGRLYFSLAGGLGFML